MAATAKETTTPGSSDEDATGEEPYGVRVSKIVGWAVTALAGAASFAVASLGFEKLVDGSWTDEASKDLLTAIALLTLGVVAVVGGAIWITHADRVTLRGLEVARRFTTLRAVRKRIEGADHLLDGHDTISSFRSALEDKVQTRRNDPVSFQADDNERLGLRIMISAKADALQTAKAERVSIVASRAVALMAIGAVVAATSGAWLALLMSDAQERRAADERKVGRDEATLEGIALVPPPLTVAYLQYPAEEPAAQELVAALGESCPSGVEGTVIEVGVPPEPVAATRVVRFLVPQTEACARAELWVSPDWLSAEAPPAPTDGGGSATTTTPTAPTTTEQGG